ncbi:retention module-containing protein, partial [Campylobacter suis]|uniref:retention module-containing protein n=1 Tax=Campylobacter suis TaxID=2790657 RepID=UPI001E2F0D8E
MATQVGTVRQITGSVIAVDANGNQRTLQVGDAIFLGEVVKTAGNSKAVLSMDNGKDVSILDNDTMTIDQSASSNVSFGNDTVTDITDLQRAILAGEDLTQLEETAAGGNAGGGGEGTAMLNESYFAQGGNESNVYGDSRNLDNNPSSFATPIQPIGTGSDDDAGNKSPVGTATAGDVTPPSAPDVTANPDGSVTITPKDDSTETEIKFTKPDGTDETVTVTKDPDTGKWSTPNTDVTVNPDTGVVTIPEDKVKDNTPVTTTTTDDAGNKSPVGTATAGDVTPPSAPDVTANPDGSVTITP